MSPKDVFWILEMRLAKLLSGTERFIMDNVEYVEHITRSDCVEAAFELQNWGYA